MRIIDFHTHIYPEKIAQKATDAIGRFYDYQPMEQIGDISALLKSMEETGIDMCVIHSVATSAAQVERINDFVCENVKAHPQKLMGFGTMHQDYENMQAEVDRCISMGLKGIKLHPDTQEFNADDERMMPLYAYLEEKGLPVLFHVGDKRYDYSHPARIRKICEAFPNLQVIAAHFGGWSVWEIAEENLLKVKNCMMDTSSSSGFITAEEFAHLIHTFGADRLLFGSDFPMWDPKGELERFMNVSLTDEEREKILYKNAEAILKID